MFKSPYWEAAKYAFMITGGIGVALAAVKGVQALASKGITSFIGGMMGIPTGTVAVETEPSQENPDDKTTV